MPRDQLRELQLDRLKKMVQYVYVSSPFHRRNFEAVGVHPDDIRSLDDIEKLPFTDKDVYNESQLKDPPYGDILCVPKEKLVRYWTTTGTTMRPRVFGTTLKDYYSYLETAARVLGAAGVGPGSRVAVFFPPWPLDRALGESMTLPGCYLAHKSSLWAATARNTGLQNSLNWVSTALWHSQLCGSYQ